MTYYVFGGTLNLALSICKRSQTSHTPVGCDPVINKLVNVCRHVIDCVHYTTTDRDTLTSCSSTRATSSTSSTCVTTDGSWELQNVPDNLEHFLETTFDRSPDNCGLLARCVTVRANYQTV